MKTYAPTNKLLAGPPPDVQKQADLPIGESLALQALEAVEDLEKRVNFLTCALDAITGVAMRTQERLQKLLEIVKIEEPKEEETNAPKF